MSIEMIKAIKEAEDKAEAIKNEAMNEAKQIVSNANLEASTILEDARRKADFSSRDFLKNAMVDAKKLYDEVIEKAIEECKKISIEADRNMEGAIAIILERIVSVDGDS